MKGEGRREKKIMKKRDKKRKYRTRERKNRVKGGGSWGKVLDDGGGRASRVGGGVGARGHSIWPEGISGCDREWKKRSEERSGKG